ncbi:enoyl-CoA hydratase-related protein [Pseudobacteriovorax antillogorgiicola]|uniref:Methylglutaconyl-CoA hydratase n=1 Tax=Pseudobacteriovorax antillogorgiicola TaxID=1513793 RepID=A0A1Y6CJC0_9BACT|nr:enoyl-CoA hydratase-related protein [Pseudobacteriovorax antillogorgiicola]TCS46154.1 methylglutaconyl-CoA hydratase [Pseudobacteriovorax antillogorgiicola]SMF69824.1 methylglutaconyl-CoA hydratase [Pseudobacteriovorax antillogorgiicola]
MSDPVIVQYTPLQSTDGEESNDKIASICINRPGSANAFSGEILVAIAKTLEVIAKDPHVRLLLFQSVGKHFSAGADLNWMKESAQLGYEHNVKEAQKLTAMFEQICAMPMPTIAVAKGAVYGGAVGIIACCDYSVALDNTRFCLSEARVGLIPAVILPYLSRKMKPSSLRRFTLSAQVFNAEQAKSCGLIEEIQTVETINEWLIGEANHILAASPEAQVAYKILQDTVNSHSNAQIDETAQSIAKIRATPMGQEGLGSFFEKRKPIWVRSVAPSESLFMVP